MIGEVSWDPKEDDRGLLSIQSSLVVLKELASLYHRNITAQHIPLLLYQLNHTLGQIIIVFLVILLSSSLPVRGSTLFA